jgi:thioredoxin-dependent peroxiredoxin
MAKITLKGNPVHTSGNLPARGRLAPGFSLVKSDLGTLPLSELKCKKLIISMKHEFL